MNDKEKMDKTLPTSDAIDLIFDATTVAELRATVKEIEAKCIMAPKLWGCMLDWALTIMRRLEVDNESLTQRIRLEKEEREREREGEGAEQC